MSITINDLAHLCGVSRGTVDRALHDRGAVREETKRYILDMAKKHGYTPNFIASSLATGRSRSVGIIVFELSNPFFTQVVSAAEHELLAHGLFSYICLSDKDKMYERKLVQDLARRQVDGIIILPINEDEAFHEFARKLPIPIVVIANKLKGIHYVGGDGNEAVQRGMEHFRKRGYHTVHFVCPPLRNLGRENLYTQIERLAGYRAYLDTHPEIGGEEIITENYLQKVRALARKGGERVGFFCSSDHYALKIFRMAREENMAIPEDFALMGFDGVDNVLNYLEKRLSTIYYPPEEIGVSAARMLSALISGVEQPMEQLISCPLLPGETV